MTSILKGGFECKVSSVLNRDVKQFGKKNLFDGNEETCWNSDQGSPQFITISLPKEEKIATVTIQFQGGFVGRDCLFQYCATDSKKKEEPFYPDDSNSIQNFHLTNNVVTNQFTILFQKSTDFFGRIVIYKLDVLSPEAHTP